VAAMMVQLLQHVVFLGHRLELDHRHVATLGEIAGLVEHIGDAARHAGREVTARLADHNDHAAGHVFAAVVAHAFHDRHGAGVTHGEALARNAAEVAFALDGTVEHRVADDDRLLGHDLRFLRRAYDDTATRKPLADIVVAV